MNLRILVTNLDSVRIGEDDESLIDAIRDAVFQGATAFEVRDLEIDVPLLATPAAMAPAVTVNVTEDIRDMVEKELRKRAIAVTDQTWSALMTALPDGTYTVCRKHGSIEMHRA